MMRSPVCLVALCSWVVGCLASWKPADGVVDLDAVETALRKVEHAPLNPEQRKVATRVVGDVDRVVAQLSSNTKLTKVEKMKKAKAAIEELQGLQSQWELAAVEGALTKITDLPKLSAAQRTAAKKVVADVEATVKDVEAGKLVGAARNKRVALAIQELQTLEREWTNVSTVERVDALEKEIAAKKMLLKKDEMELKLAGLEKELAQKKLMLKKLTADKDQARDAEKQRKEDAAQEAMVARLLATAKALAAKAKNKTKPEHAQAAQPTGDATLAALASDLWAQEQNVSSSIARMDAEEKARQAEMSSSVQKVAKAPAEGKTEATNRGQKMLTQLMKQEHRNYLKARAVKEAQRKEIDDGLQSIQRRDVAGLAKLMQKMQTEQKSLQARAKNFLY